MSNDGALRFNEGKRRYDLIPWHVLPTAEDHEFLSNMSEFILGLAGTEKPGDTCLVSTCETLLEDLVNWATIDDLALLYEKGLAKYALFNWYKGLTASDILASVSRHLKAYEVDEDTRDIETGLPHLVHAAWGYITMLVFLREGRLVNDYFNGKETE